MEGRRSGDFSKSEGWRITGSARDASLEAERPHFEALRRLSRGEEWRGEAVRGSAIIQGLADFWFRVKRLTRNFRVKAVFRPSSFRVKVSRRLNTGLRVNGLTRVPC